MLLGFPATCTSQYPAPVPTAPIGWDTTLSGDFGSLSRWPLNQLRSGYQ